MTLYKINFHFKDKNTPFITYVVADDELDAGDIVFFRYGIRKPNYPHYLCIDKIVEL